MILKKAGVLLSSLTGMVIIHQSDSCLKVQVPRPWLDKRRVSSTSILFKVPGCTNSSLGSIPCHELEKGWGISNHTLNITISNTLGCKDIGIRKSEFGGKAQFLCKIQISGFFIQPQS